MRLYHPLPLQEGDDSLEPPRQKLPARRIGLLIFVATVLCGVAFTVEHFARQLPGPRRSPASVCSLLKRVLPQSGVDEIITELVRTAEEPHSLVLDVGLAHGKECFAIAEAGHICRGFEADPVHAKAVREKATKHPNASLLQIHSAAAGDANSVAVFFADRHNKHGVGGTLSPRANGGSGSGSALGKSGSGSLPSGWESVEVPIVRLDGQVGAAEKVFLLKSDTQGHELSVLRGASGLFAKRRVQFVLVEMAIALSASGDQYEGEAKQRVQVEEATQIAELLNDAGFICCDLPWHDRAGGRYAGPPAKTDAWGWANHLQHVPRGRNGFYFTDLLCELGGEKTPIVKYGLEALKSKA